MGGRLPDNRILSHDLLEGCYARSGLLTDVQLYEEYPSRYSEDVSRRHRWIRGDWQIGQWVLPRVPGADGRLHKNPLSILSRWKILDNLRRSLNAAALTSLLLLGWTVLSFHLFWTLTVISIMLLPSLFAAALSVLHKSADVNLREHLTAEAISTSRRLAEAAFNFVCLPYEAFYSLNAIAHTAWRMIVTHRNLLEWKPSGNSDHNNGSSLIDSFRTMWFSPVLSVVTIAGAGHV